MELKLDNPLIIVFYINVGNMSRMQMEDHLAKVMHEYKTEQPTNCITYFIAVSDQPTKVECINPKYVTDKEYKEIRDRLDKIQKQLDEKKV